MLVIASASATGRFGEPNVIGAQRVLQVGLGDQCGKWATVWSIGNIMSEMSSFDVEMRGDATTRCAVFMHRFRPRPSGALLR